MNKKTLLSLIRGNIPVLLWGPPGVGKTASLRALANEQGARVTTLIGSTLDPTDICGVPYISGQILKNSTPEWVLELQKNVAELGEGKAWLFLDELSCSPPSVHAALLRIVHERTVGSHSIAGCRIIAAANPTDSAAVGGELSPATANRWAHLDYTVEVGEWIAGELSGWGKKCSPEKLQAAALVTGFIGSNPSKLLLPPKLEEGGSTAWPSPRSWSHAVEALSFCSGSDHFNIVAACVGVGAAKEFEEYRQKMDLPNPADMLSGKSPLPTRGDKLYAATMALVAHSVTVNSQTTAEQVWKILKKIRPDVALPAAKAMLKSSNYNTPAIRDIANKILEAENG